MSLCAPLCLCALCAPLCSFYPGQMWELVTFQSSGGLFSSVWHLLQLPGPAAVFVYLCICICICVFVCMYLYICVYVFVFVLHICICPLWRLRDQVPLPPHLTSSPITFAEAAVRQLSDHRPIPNRPERRVGPGGPSASIARGPGSARVSRQSSVARLG